MKEFIYERLNEVLNTNMVDVNEVNSLLLNLENDLDFHSHLTSESLGKVYEIINELVLSIDAKEHIVWCYHKNKYEKQSKIVDDELFNSLIFDFRKYSFSLNSILISMLKDDSLSIIQVNKLKNENIDNKLLARLIREFEINKN